MKLHNRYGKARTRYSWRRRITGVLAGIIVFTTTYALVLPAVTLDESTAADEPGIELETESDSASEELSVIENTEREIEKDTVEPEDSLEEAPAADSGFEEENPDEESVAQAESSAEEFNSPEESTAPEDSSDNSIDEKSINDENIDQDHTDQDDIEEESFVPAESSAEDSSVEDSSAGDSFAEETAAPADDSEEPAETLTEDSTVASNEESAETPTEDQTKEPVKAPTEDKNEESAEDPTEDPAKETVAEPPLEYPAQDFEALAGDIRITVSAPEGAFPAGTVMMAESVEDESILTAASEAVEGEVRSVRAVDIVFFDSNGVEIEPLQPVRVSMSSVIVEAAEEIQVVHVDNEGVAEIVEQAGDVESADDEVVFDAGGFSVYVLVETDSITTRYLSAEGVSYEITVTFDKTAEIPEDAVLLVSELKEEDDGYDSLIAQTAAAIGSDVSILEYIKLLDISIADADGNKVKLNAPVDVEIRLLDEISSEENIQIVHFAEDSEKKNVEPELLDNTGEGETVIFQTSGFSAYAIVQGPHAAGPGWIRVSSLDELKTLAAEGIYIGTSGNYYLTDTTAAHQSVAGLSGIKRSASTRAYPTDDAALYYFEEVPGQNDQFYICCYDADNNKLYATYDTTVSKVPYSIILTADETLKTPCTLSYTGSYWRIRFNNNANLRWYQRDNIFDAQNSDMNFTFWKSISTDQDSYGLDGKTYGLMYWTDGIVGKALMSTANETAGHLDALPLTVLSKPKNGAKLYVPDDSDISFWTFRFIDTDKYYLTTVVDGSTKYLRIASDGLTLVSVPDDQCKIRVVPGSGNNAGRLYLKSGNSTLAYSGSIDSGFKVGGTAGTEWLNLVEESELDNTYFMKYSARKVSVSDETVTDGSRIIVYTRVWNHETGKYEFYAVDHDGSLVRCYESGDSIEWVAGRLNSMLWSFIEHYWEGTNDPNYFYDFYNQYSERFLAPQLSGDQILVDDLFGVNLNGRRKGQYYTPIIAWDEGSYAYSGLKADTASGMVVPCPVSEADSFYFAIVQDIPVDDELTTVPTVDHKKYGITMKMINFGTDLYTGNDDKTARASMTRFLGSNDKFVNFNTEAGLLETQLDGNGYPVTKAGNNMSAWFEGAQEVNHLFIASTYSNSGYFEFDSVQNFAHLDPDTHDFVVYKELGSDSSTGETHRHGLFFPYNDITAGVFSVNKNTTSISAQNLPESDPRKYEKLYLVQKSNTNYAPDYCFGMEVTASFTQTLNGKDNWGHDIIYEFTGDDDFWLFVDGELIIDLGGIHSAIPGTVNYSTGVVTVNGTVTSLRALFESNYRGRNADATDAEVEAYLNDIFDGEIFKPYTTHTMKIYYLERGRGSSNLHMRFNLASIKPGTVQLSKTLSGVDMTGTVLAEFPYQIIYRTKTGNDEPVEHYLTNAVRGDQNRKQDYVCYKDTITPCTYKTSMAIAGKTYNDVFILNPDDIVTVEFPVESFPQGTELLDYRIIECGVDTDVYTGVSVNDISVDGTAVSDDLGNAIENRMDYGIGFATTKDRARVGFDNTVDPDAVTDLAITKKVYDVTGENEITAAEDDTTFDFRLYLATESGNIDESPANLHTYHVKDPNGDYCRWSKEQQRIVPLGAGKNDFTALTPDEQLSATFHTSMNGSITQIPIGYTIEVRNLLAGTKFKVVERPGEVPDGYSFMRYAYDGVMYADALSGVTDVIGAGEKPEVEIDNIKGFGLRVNKSWTDADYMEDRDPAYFGVFYLDNSNELQPVEGSLREMPYGKSSLYWYYDHLPVSGLTDFGNYQIYEVSLTGPVTDNKGTVLSYSGLTVIGEGETVSLNGKLIGDTQSAFTYTVSYQRGEPDSNSNVRVDEVTNSRPGIIFRKTAWDGTPLAGAVFTLADAEGHTIGTYTSGEDGLITEAFLRDNVEYTLTETASPQGYHGVEAPMTIVLDAGEVTVTGSDDSYYTASSANETESAVVTVKNRPYEFRVIKMDKGTGRPLSKVRFALYREIVVDGVHSWDPNPYPGYENLSSGSDGRIPQLDNTLPPGRYQLRETKELSGYQKISGHIVFTVTGNGSIEISGNLPEEAVFEDPAVQNDGSILYQITVTNSKVYKVSVWKTNEGYEVITSGAEFSLYKAEDYDDITGTVHDGAKPVVSGTTGSNGILSLGSLTVGEYRLLETRAPNGYVLPSSAVKIWITNSGVTASQASQPSDVYKKGNSYWVTGQDNSTLQIRVWNSSGVELPHTGGSGTLLYTLGGLIIMGAAVLIFSIKRISAHNPMILRHREKGR